jgi:hypothetical protein
VTFKELQDDVLERINNNSNEARLRIRRFLNEWHRRILSEVGLGQLRDAETTLAVTNAADEYTLAAGIRKIRAIQNEADNTTLQERTLEWMRQVDPDDSMTGAPLYYAMRSDRKIKFKPYPDDNYTLTIDYEARIANMVDDDDEPLIPEDFHYLLVLGARANEYDKNEDSRLRATQAELAGGIARLKHWVAVRPRTILSAGGTARHSRLGSWFPAE